jgi:hypothetical protein
MLPLKHRTTHGFFMKRLLIDIFPCITVIALAALFLSGCTGASTVMQPTRTTSTCGVWSRVSSPNVGRSTNFLNGVAAISANNVWAVGSYGDGHGGLTLIEHWNGTQWKVIASPNVNGSRSDELSGVAALAANNIWAAGNYYNASNTQQTLIEHWNGTNWSIVPSPNVTLLFTVLTAISAVSAMDIWAVGNYSGLHGYQTLIEHWNGARWSIVPSPSPDGGQLTGVAAIASNNVWAVGSGAGAQGIQTLIEHWNGATWSVVSSSGPGLATNTLSGIAASSANDIWAVGWDANSVTPSSPYAPLLEHWNGSSWSVVTGPLQGTSDLLSGIAVASASNIWAVGDYRSSTDPMGPYFTLIEHWNGATWSVVNSPSPGSMASDLVAAVRVPATSSTWAVGFTQDSTHQTLTAFYC